MVRVPAKQVCYGNVFVKSIKITHEDVRKSAGGVMGELFTKSTDLQEPDNLITVEIVQDFKAKTDMIVFEEHDNSTFCSITFAMYNPKPKDNYHYTNQRVILIPIQNIAGMVDIEFLTDEEVIRKLSEIFKEART